MDTGRCDHSLWLPREVHTSEKPARPSVESSTGPTHTSTRRSDDNAICSVTPIGYISPTEPARGTSPQIRSARLATELRSIHVIFQHGHGHLLNETFHRLAAPSGHSVRFERARGPPLCTAGWHAHRHVVGSRQLPRREGSSDVRGRSFWEVITGCIDGRIMVRRCLVTFKPFR